jgi:hypothetical protein
MARCSTSLPTAFLCSHVSFSSFAFRRHGKREARGLARAIPPDVPRELWRGSYVRSRTEPLREPTATTLTMLAAGRALRAPLSSLDRVPQTGQRPAGPARDCAECGTISNDEEVFSRTDSFYDDGR